MGFGVLPPDMWRTLRRVAVLQEPQGLVGVHRRAHLVGDDLEYGAVGVDDECGSSDRQQPGQQATAPGVPAMPGRLTLDDGSTQLGEPASAHPEHLGHHAVRVGEQRIVERALLGKVRLPVDGVGADADPVGAHRGEFATQIPKMTRLGCTDRRGRYWEEEKHNRPIGKERGQCPGPTGVIVQSEIRRLVARNHRQRLTRPALRDPGLG
jgi:hypothetical protein